jgi:hypothetical protein
MFPETAFGFVFLPSARLWGAAGRIGGIESLGEPAVDRGEEVVGLGGLAWECHRRVRRVASSILSRCAYAAAK